MQGYPRGQLSPQGTVTSHAGLESMNIIVLNAQSKTSRMPSETHPDGTVLARTMALCP